jgi:mannose-6-phosphate isomerase-like protein (cupin superfamily)
MPFYRWADLPGRDRPGNRVLRMVSSEHATILRVEHHGPASHEPHVHEECDQISSLVEGEMEFTVAGETRLVKPGELVVVPAGVLHGTRVPAGVYTVALEFFTPPRKDL